MSRASMLPLTRRVGRLLALAAALVLSSAPVTADDGRADFEAVRAAVLANRQAVIAENLPLSSAEAERFWPLYRQYREERDVLADRRIEGLEAYYEHMDDMPDALATRLLDDYLALQAELLALKKRYVSRFREILSQQQTLRYFQLEHRLDAMVEDELAQGIPLASQAPDRPR
jgi:hypothetical protein